MLSSNVIKLLNDQMNLEFYSSNLYLQMSAWCEQNGFEGAAKFLFTYLNETGALAVITAIEAPAHEYKSLKEIIELTYEHEKLITSKINELVGKTFEEKDYSAFNFLQWYVAEQHEEEKLFSGILDKLNLLGEDGKGLFLIDKDLGNLAGQTA